MIEYRRYQILPFPSPLAMTVNGENLVKLFPARLATTVSEHSSPNPSIPAPCDQANGSIVNLCTNSGDETALTHEFHQWPLPCLLPFVHLSSSSLCLATLKIEYWNYRLIEV